METVYSTVQTWSNFGDGAGFTANWSNEESFSPVYSLNISRTVIDTVKIWYWWQKYSGIIPVGRDLTLKAKIKAVNLSGDGVSIVIRCDGEVPNLQFASTQGVVNINGTFDWSTYTVSLPNVQSNITSIFVFLVYRPKTTGKVYFDDVTLSYN